MYKLYVIPGSHACRSAMLMLEQKGQPYKRVDVVTLTHPVASRLNGFNAGGETRVAGSKRTIGIRLGDMLGTVPALKAGDERISTNRQIARFLDDRHPDPPFFPADPEKRRKVEEAERWGNETFQMSARRILAAAALQDPATFAKTTANGRMGYLLYRRELTRRMIIPGIARVFNATGSAERDLLADLPAQLDRIDAWMNEGVLGGDPPNAADLMIAPSLALMLYRPDIMPFLEGRPALELVDRLLPEPA